MQFDIKNEEHREKLACETAFYMMMLGCKDTRKFLHIPNDYITEGGFPLGRIWEELQRLYSQNQLSESEIRFLLKIRMQFTESPQKNLEIWLDRADEVEEYYKEHGSLSMPSTTLFRNGGSMFQWVHNQKKHYQQGWLSLYQKEHLENIGIQWIEPREIVTWEDGYCHAEAFFNENGHLFVKRNYVDLDGFALGKWIQEQRKCYLGESVDLDDDKIDMLEEIGMFWEDIQNAEWDWFVGLLWECIRKTKKPFVIGKNYRYKNYALGEHVNKVIVLYGEGRLSKEQEKDLQNVGFKFNRVIK